jgi:hypothetical protein
MIWFFVSIAFSLIAWGVVTARYFWPELRLRPRVEALRPLLILHSFRFIGLAFLVPGVVTRHLPPAFDLSAFVRTPLSGITVTFAQNTPAPCRYLWRRLSESTKAPPTSDPKPLNGRTV